MPRTSDGYPCAFHPRFQSSKACRSRLGSVTKVSVWTRRDSYYLWLRHYLQPGVFLLLLTTFCFWCSSVVIVKAQGATATLSGTVMDHLHHRSAVSRLRFTLGAVATVFCAAQ